MQDQEAIYYPDQQVQTTEEEYQTAPSPEKNMQSYDATPNYAETATHTSLPDSINFEPTTANADASGSVFEEPLEVERDYFNRYGEYHNFGNYTVNDSFIAAVYGRYQNNEIDTLCWIPMSDGDTVFHGKDVDHHCYARCYIHLNAVPPEFFIEMRGVDLRKDAETFRDNPVPKEYVDRLKRTWLGVTTAMYGYHSLYKGRGVGQSIWRVTRAQGIVVIGTIGFGLLCVSICEPARMPEHSHLRNTVSDWIKSLKYRN